MATHSPQRTEVIRFVASAPVSDGAGGTLPGEEQVLCRTLAIVRPLKASRLLEASQTQLRQGYEFEIWVQAGFEPITGITILYRDERLTNQGYRYTDETRRRYVITALEQIRVNG